MMGNLPVGSDLHAFARKLPNVLCRDFVPPMGIHRVKSLDGPGAGFRNSLSRAAREYYSRYTNRLEKDFSGRYEVKCYREPQDLYVIMKDSEEVARKTYQRALQAGFIDNEECRSRYDLALRKKWLRVYILYIDGAPAAFWSGMLYRRVFFLWDTGYDSEFRWYSVGTYLALRMMEDLHREHAADSVDFGFGDAEYKRHLTDGSWTESFVCIFSPSVRGVAINGVRTFVGILARAAGHVLQRTGSKDRLKTFWRNRLKTSKGSDGGNEGGGP
jgi:hypothetical protein